jgi:hypothetical protein
MQRATCNAQHPSATWSISQWPRRQVSYNLNLQHCTTRMQQARTPYKSIVRSIRCNIPPHTMQGSYNAPHATLGNTHNCGQRGSRTTVERAMLPPLNSIDPPDILATPPLCTSPPQSASGPIGLPCHAHRCGCIGDRHRLELDGPTPHLQHAAFLHASQHARGSSSESPVWLLRPPWPARLRRSKRAHRKRLYASTKRRPPPHSARLPRSPRANTAAYRPASAGMGWRTHTVDE